MKTIKNVMGFTLFSLIFFFVSFLFFHSFFDWLFDLGATDPIFSLIGAGAVQISSGKKRREWYGQLKSIKDMNWVWFYIIARSIIILLIFGVACFVFKLIDDVVLRSVFPGVLLTQAWGYTWLLCVVCYFEIGFARGRKDFIKKLYAQYKPQDAAARSHQDAQSVTGPFVFLLCLLGVSALLIASKLAIEEISLNEYLASLNDPINYWPFFVAISAALMVAYKAKPAAPIPQQEKAETHTSRRWVIPVREKRTFNGHTTHGTAFFLGDEVKEALTNGLEGLWLGGGFVHHKKGHVLTCASPRSGKTAGLIIPNLLLPRRNYKKSFIINDPKSTICYTTADIHKKSGQQVVIIDPFRMQQQMRAKHGIEAVGFNPMEFLSLLDNNVITAVTRMAAVMLPYTQKDGENDFTYQAKQILEALILYVAVDPRFSDSRNLVTVYKLIAKGDWDGLFLDMLDSDVLDFHISDMAKKFINLKLQTEKTFGSTVFSLGRGVDWIKDPAIQTALQGGYNPFGLADGGMTVYFCIPFDKAETYAVFTRLFFDFSIRANAMPSPRPKEWCYYFLDEFPSMGKYPEIIKAMATYSEYNMRFWLFIQELAQLENLYGQAGRSEIIGLCDVFQAFGLNDQKSAEYVSDTLGSLTVPFDTENKGKSRSWGTSTSATSGSSSSSTSGSNDGWQENMGSSQNFTARKLLYPDEVRKEEHIICLIKGMGNMRLKRWFYFDPPQNIHERYWSYNFRKQMTYDNPNETASGNDDLQMAKAS